MNFRIVVTAAPTRRKRKSANGISNEPGEGFAKMEGQDERGKIKVWARMSLDKPFKLVDTVAQFYHAELFVRQLEEDDRYRRICLRQAKREGLQD